MLGDALRVRVKGTVTVVLWGAAAPPGPDALIVNVVVDFTGTIEDPEVGSEPVSSVWGTGGHNRYRCGVGGGPGDCCGLAAVYGRRTRRKCYDLRLNWLHYLYNGGLRRTAAVIRSGSDCRVRGCLRRFIGLRAGSQRAADHGARRQTRRGRDSNSA